MDHQPTLPTLIDADQLQANLEQIWAVTQRTKARILLDQTTFPAWPLYPMLGLYLSGTTAVNAAQAKTGLTQMDRDSHGLLSPNASADVMDMLPLCHHMTFSTLDQWRQSGAKVQAAGLTCALNIQPTDQCAPGISLSALSTPLPKGVIGLRLQLQDPTDLAALEGVLSTVETRCSALLPRLQRFSIGGNFPLTDPDFDLARLEQTLLRFRETHGLLLCLEVGRAVTRNAVAPLPHPPQFSFPFPEGYPPLYLKEGDQVRPFSHF